MRTTNHGHTLVEMLVVIAIVGILTAITVPLGSFWVQNTRLTATAGDLTHGIGKAIGAAFRNQHAVDVGDPVTALCISNSRELTVLEGTASSTPSCATAASPLVGNVIWESALPKGVAVSNNGVAVGCMCFVTTGLLTTEECSGCLTGNTLDLTIGDKNETIFVY